MHMVRALLPFAVVCNTSFVCYDCPISNEATMKTMGKLTHWGQDKMATNSLTTFSKAFSWIKMYEFGLIFHWSLFARVQLTIFQHWFRQRLGAGQATSHYLNQWWLAYWRIYASLGLNELNTNQFAINDIITTPNKAWQNRVHNLWDILYIWGRTEGKAYKAAEFQYSTAMSPSILPRYLLSWYVRTKCIGTD